jgi:hypothetical protein
MLLPPEPPVGTTSDDLRMLTAEPLEARLSTGDRCEGLYPQAYSKVIRM